MEREEDINQEKDELLENLYDVPGIPKFRSMIEHPVFQAPKVSPYYKETLINGRKIIGLELALAAREDPNSYYYTLNDFNRRIVDLYFTTNIEDSMSYREIAEMLGVGKGQVSSIIARFRAKVTGEIKLE